ncbi:MAG TPA: thioredoxin TrxC [Alphaproteobacteria bacterium]
MADTATKPTLLVACPHCGTLNRIPADRLGAGGKCGNCHQALFTGHPAALDAKSFDHHAKADLPLVVDFWAAWCGPCKMMAPVFEQLAAEMEPRVRFGKVDVDAQQELGARYQIRSIPTVAVFHRGREIARQAGAMPAQVLRQWIEQHLPR